MWHIGDNDGDGDGDGDGHNGDANVDIAGASRCSQMCYNALDVRIVGLLLLEL